MEECLDAVTADKKKYDQVWLGVGWGQEAYQKKSSQTPLGSSLGASYQQMAHEASLKKYVFAPRQANLEGGGMFQEDTG